MVTGAHWYYKHLILVFFTIFRNWLNNHMGYLRTDDVYKLCKTLLLVVYRPFQSNILFWYPLKTSENLRFFDAFGAWGMDHWFEMN